MCDDDDMSPCSEKHRNQAAARQMGSGVLGPILAPFQVLGNYLKDLLGDMYGQTKRND